MNKEVIADEFRTIQENICTSIEQADGIGKFVSDIWSRHEGGGGDTRILQNGNVLEKAGVNFSAVHGEVTDRMKAAFGFPEGSFYATGVSIVMHPGNPFVPIIHMNIRYFETGPLWWFGGGIDLTPIYIFPDDVIWFHQELKCICDKHDKSFYPRFREWADNYFFIPHRNETRGVGGIFFDRLSSESTGKSKEELFAFVTDVGRLFAPVYSQIIARNKDREYTAANKKWQSIRRSRYVEFNLLYDKGTRFGLDTDGRVESILMSMPPLAEWLYNYLPAEGTSEWETQKMLIKNKAWV